MLESMESFLEIMFNSVHPQGWKTGQLAEGKSNDPSKHVLKYTQKRK